MDRRFELNETGFVAYGETLPQLFENAGVAAFAGSFPVGDIAPTYSRPLVAPGDSLEELLANWVEELLAMGRVEDLAVSYVTVDRLEEGGVQGSGAGLPRSEVSRIGPDAEGVDRSQTRVVEIPDGWWAALTLR